MALTVDTSAETASHFEEAERLFQLVLKYCSEGMWERITESSPEVVVAAKDTINLVVSADPSRLELVDPVLRRTMGSFWCARMELKRGSLSLLSSQKPIVTQSSEPSTIANNLRNTSVNSMNGAAAEVIPLPSCSSSAEVEAAGQNLVASPGLSLPITNGPSPCMDVVTLSASASYSERIAEPLTEVISRPDAVASSEGSSDGPVTPLHLDRGVESESSSSFAELAEVLPYEDGLPARAAKLTAIERMTSSRKRRGSVAHASVHRRSSVALVSPTPGRSAGVLESKVVVRPSSDDGELALSGRGRQDRVPQSNWCERCIKKYQKQLKEGLPEGERIRCSGSNKFSAKAGYGCDQCRPHNIPCSLQRDAKLAAAADVLTKEGRPAPGREVKKRKVGNVSDSSIKKIRLEDHSGLDAHGASFNDPVWLVNQIQNKLASAAALYSELISHAEVAKSAVASTGIFVSQLRAMCEDGPLLRKNDVSASAEVDS